MTFPFAESPTYDVCIVGGGAGGLVLAETLGQRGRRVLLVESGGDSPPLDSVEDPFVVRNEGVPYRGSLEGRFRAFGGTTTRWGGQLWPWEPWEADARSWVPNSGWPLRWDEVSPYYPLVLKSLGMAPDSFSDRYPGEGNGSMPTAQDVSIKYSRWLPWSKRNLGRTVGKRLKRMDSVDIRLQTTALEILLAEDGDAVTGIRVCDASGSESVFRARSYVLACGTIENARLLLDSDRVARGGVGNQHSQVGRYLQDHLSIRVAQLIPWASQRFRDVFAPSYEGRILRTPRLVPSQQVLHERAMLLCYGHVEVVYGPDSVVTLAKSVLRSFQQGHNLRPSWRGARRALAGTADAARLAHGLLVHRQRLFPRDAMLFLRVDTEQQPTPDSRVRLGNEHDSQGRRRVVVDWHVSDLDMQTVRQAAKVFGSAIETTGLAAVRPVPEPGLGSPLANDSLHAMGTTRMSESLRTGVVTKDCQVHGVSNLYVAGASVFPTGGMGNPTFTLMALARRLGDHLDATLHSSAA